MYTFLLWYYPFTSLILGFFFNNRILRGETSTSNIHFFSTQFFQKVKDGGAKSVQGWTKRRSINVFEKKFIVIPINYNNHWSLCVIVNPGKIENAYRDDNNEVQDNVDLPFILLLDSLKLHHKKEDVGPPLYAWLNFEARSRGMFQNLKKDGDHSNSEIFSSDSVPLLQPKGE